MIVLFDASTLVGAALRRDSIPRRALGLARVKHVIALSAAVFDEIQEVLGRPKFTKSITAETREEILGLLTVSARWAEPNTRVVECRDPGDDIYLELAAKVGAGVIVASDGDLLVMDPWRGVRVLRPRAFLEAFESGAGEGPRFSDF